MIIINKKKKETYLNYLVAKNSSKKLADVLKI